MSSFWRRAVAVAFATALSAGPAAAAPLGVYQTTDRKMDYRLETCGKDDKALCVTLLAARGSSATEGVKPFIGKLIVNQAPPAGTNKWRGKMRVGQHELSGSLTLTPGQKFVMSGCAYIVICDDFTLIPAQ